MLRTPKINNNHLLATRDIYLSENQILYVKILFYFNFHKTVELGYHAKCHTTHNTK